jgi:hypothetical protein
MTIHTQTNLDSKAQLVQLCGFESVQNNERLQHTEPAEASRISASSVAWRSCNFFISPISACCADWCLRGGVKDERCNIDNAAQQESKICAQITNHCHTKYRTQRAGKSNATQPQYLVGLLQLRDLRHCLVLFGFQLFDLLQQFALRVCKFKRTL